jgi:hypothetical protein
MPTAIAILLAATAAAAPAELRLTAELMGLRVRAALRNEGPAPLTLTIADRCAGSALVLVVDGKQRPFASAGRRCLRPQPVQRTLAPGSQYAVLSDALDGRRHTVVVQLGPVASPPLSVPTAVRVDVKLAATAQVHAGQPVDLEVAHVNRSPEEIEVTGCGDDRLLIDDHEQPMPLSGECPATRRSIKVRGAFVTRGRLLLPPGRHRLRARWRESQSADVTVDVSP